MRFNELAVLFVRSFLYALTLLIVVVNQAKGSFESNDLFQEGRVMLKYSPSSGEVFYLDGKTESGSVVLSCEKEALSSGSHWFLKQHIAGQCSLHFEETLLETKVNSDSFLPGAGLISRVSRWLLTYADERYEIVSSVKKQPMNYGLDFNPFDQKVILSPQFDTLPIIPWILECRDNGLFAFKAVTADRHNEYHLGGDCESGSVYLSPTKEGLFCETQWTIEYLFVSCEEIKRSIRKAFPGGRIILIPDLENDTFRTVFPTQIQDAYTSIMCENSEGFLRLKYYYDARNFNCEDFSVTLNDGFKKYTAHNSGSQYPPAFGLITGQTSESSKHVTNFYIDPSLTLKFFEPQQGTEIECPFIWKDDPNMMILLCL
tara:strand:- start:889 stop:2007 length:1119 start_codon:yes stop_codon:yes gene_type:complete